MVDKQKNPQSYGSIFDELIEKIKSDFAEIFQNVVVKPLKEGADKNCETLSTAIGETHNVVDKVSQGIVTISKDVVAIKSSVESNKKTVEDVQTKVEAIDSKVQGDLTEMFDLAKAINENIKGELKRLSDARTEAKEKAATLKQEVDRLNEQNERLTEDLDRLEKESDRVKSDLKETRNTLKETQDTLEDKIEDWKKEKQTLEGEKEKAENEARAGKEFREAVLQRLKPYKELATALNNCPLLAKIETVSSLLEGDEMEVSFNLLRRLGSDDFAKKFMEGAETAKRSDKKPLADNEIDVYRAFNACYRDAYGIDFDILVLPWDNEEVGTPILKKVTFRSDCAIDVNSRALKRIKNVYTPLLLSAGNRDAKLRLALVATEN